METTICFHFCLVIKAQFVISLGKLVTFTGRRLTHVAIETLKWRQPQEMAFINCDFSDIDVDCWQEMATLCSGELKVIIHHQPRPQTKVDKVWLIRWWQRKNRLHYDGNINAKKVGHITI